MIHVHKNYNEAQASYHSHIFETTWSAIRQGQGCLQICASNDFVQMQQLQHSSRKSTKNRVARYYYQKHAL